MASGKKGTVVTLLPLGYLACRRALERLHRFQDLLRHRERWATEIDLAQPLEKLLPHPLPKDNFQMSQLIDREINRLIPTVHAILQRAEINTKWIIRSEDPAEEQSRDLVYEYFELSQKNKQRNF